MSNNTEIASADTSFDSGETFLLRWRGRQDGPYTLAAIEDKLSTNHIGLLHEINSNGHWFTLREFMAERQVALRAELHAREEQQRHAREEQEREDRLRGERLEAEKLQELRRQNDLLQAGPTGGNYSTQGGGGPVVQNRIIPKSRVTYIVLGLFFGLLGIHNFYAGYTARAVVQLLISIFTGWLVVPLVGVAVWVLIEVIAVKEDAQGIPFQS